MGTQKFSSTSPWDPERKRRENMARAGRRRIILARMAMTPGVGAEEEEEEIPFSPLEYTPYAWYEPSDLTTVFTDTAGTTAVSSDGQAVARINDKSGNNRHLTQATLANRPLYKDPGKLLFDGINDVLIGDPLTLNQPVDCIIAAKVLTANHGSIIVGNVAGGVGLQVLNTPSVRLLHGGAAATTNISTGVDYVFVTRADGANSRIGLDAGAYTTGDPGATGYSSISMSPGGIAHVEISSLIMFDRALTDSEISNLITYTANLQGRVL